MEIELGVYLFSLKLGAILFELQGVPPTTCLASHVLRKLLSTSSGGEKSSSPARPVGRISVDEHNIAQP